MSHPCVVRLDHHSRPRLLFAGDRAVPVSLPVGTRCIYPKPLQEPISDVAAAVRHAIDHPVRPVSLEAVSVGVGPLSAKVRPGMKVTVALGDLETPPLPSRRPDVRETILKVVLSLLAEHSIDDIEIILATGLGRRLKPTEIKQRVGARVFKDFWPARLHPHDPENADAMVEIGTTAQAEAVTWNRRALQCDLLIHIGVRMDARSEQSIVAGMCGAPALRALHRPLVTAQGTAAEVASRMMALVAAKQDVFAIEATLHNRVLDHGLDCVAKNEDDLSASEYGWLKAFIAAQARLPHGLKPLVSRAAAPIGVTGVFAGDPAAVRAKSIEHCREQQSVSISEPADVLIVGVPSLNAFPVRGFLNPLLLQETALTFACDSHGGPPLVRKGGTLIFIHPCSDRFDHQQHTAHQEFVHRMLPQTRDAQELHACYEEKFAHDPALLAMFRHGHAEHPAQAFFAWYRGEPARRHLGRVIVVGADNEAIPALLGWETAGSMQEALYRARGDHTGELDVICLPRPQWLSVERDESEVKKGQAA